MNPKILRLATDPVLGTDLTRALAGEIARLRLALEIIACLGEVTFASRLAGHEAAFAGKVLDGVEPMEALP